MGQAPGAVINAVAPTNPKQRRTSGPLDPRGPATKKGHRRWHGAEISVNEEDGGALCPTPEPRSEDVGHKAGVDEDAGPTKVDAD